MGFLKNVIQQVMAWDTSTVGIKKQIMAVFSVSEKEASHILTKAKSEKNRDAVFKAPNKFVFLPQCIRRRECKAPLGEEGYECQSCSPDCQVFQIRSRINNGARVFIAPGGTLVFKMVAKHKPGAVIGMGCFLELEQAFEQCEKLGLPAMGVPLLTEGCVGTLADKEEFFETLKQAGIYKEPAEEKEGAVFIKIAPEG